MRTTLILAALVIFATTAHAGRRDGWRTSPPAAPVVQSVVG